MPEWEVGCSSPAPHHSPWRRRVGAAGLRYRHRDTFPAQIVWLALLPLFIAPIIAPTVLEAQDVAHGGPLDSQDHPLATSARPYPAQLSGTVVDKSGAVIAGATVQVRNTDGR